MVAGKTKIQPELIAFFRSRCRRRSIWELYEDEDEYEYAIFAIERLSIAFTANGKREIQVENFLK